jgi:hypothetical protein
MQAQRFKGNSMNFGAALQELKQGNKVQRSGWNGTGLWLELHTIAMLGQLWPER